ncbi:hypothetical protein COOONC_11251 [Cooperia oncophora]
MLLHAVRTPQGSSSFVIISREDRWIIAIVAHGESRRAPTAKMKEVVCLTLIILALVACAGFRTRHMPFRRFVSNYSVCLIFLLFALCILMRRRRQPVEKEMTTYGQNGFTASTPASRPLLTAAYRAEQPTPQPRSQPPSLDARPMKSSIRKAMSPPDQYNDSRDTSFNSDSPLGMRQSRSAVV